jgi:hypothetical protein
MSFRKELALMTDPTPAAQTSEPRTAAGRRLHARIFGLSDRMPDGAELDNLILAIEAEAAALPAAPAGLDQLIDSLYAECDGWPAVYERAQMEEPPHVAARVAGIKFAIGRIKEWGRAAYAEGEPE